MEGTVLHSFLATQDDDDDDDDDDVEYGICSSSSTVDPRRHGDFPGHPLMLVMMNADEQHMGGNGCAFGFAFGKVGMFVHIHVCGQVWCVHMCGVGSSAKCVCVCVCACVWCE